MAEDTRKQFFTIEVLNKILAASTCMIDFFCKSMTASNFCDERKSALIMFSVGDGNFKVNSLRVLWSAKSKKIEIFSMQTYHYILFNLNCNYCTFLTANYILSNKYYTLPNVNYILLNKHCISHNIKQILFFIQ